MTDPPELEERSPEGRPPGYEDTWRAWRVDGVPAVLVAVSGGSDSVALAAILAELAGGVARSHRPRLRLGHVDHGLRPDSGGDAAAVEALGARLGIPVEVRRLDGAEVGWLREGGAPPLALDRRWYPAGSDGVQARARALRRSILERLAGAEDTPRIAFAHTRDDQAETLLLRAQRASDADGMGGMAPLGPGRAWRPLLGVGRAELRAWLATRGLAFRDDPSNEDEAHERVFVRRRVLPVLAARRPGVGRALARTARALAEDGEALGVWAEREYANLRDEGPVGAGYREIGLRVEALASLPVAVRRRVYRRWLIDLGLPALPYRLADRLETLLGPGRGGRGFAWPPGEFVRRGGRLVGRGRSR